MAARYRVVELIVAVCVVVISVASLFVAVYQGRVMDRTLAASVMPIMDYSSGNFSEMHQDSRIELDVRNNGLGPAQVHYLAMSYQGEPSTSLARLMADCCAPEGMSQDERQTYVGQILSGGHTNLITEIVGGRVFAPQQRIVFFAMPRPANPEALAVWEAFDNARYDLELEMCYCSVLEDCWIARFPQQSRIAVDQCEPPTGSL